MPKGTFVGFGFGPIQAGLFLYEAFRSARFGRLVVAEVDPELVQALRRARGRYRLNVAGQDGVAVCEVAGVEVLNPSVPADAEALVAALAEASEVATALPSVGFYDRGAPPAATLLAAAMRRKSENRLLPRALVYAAENHNHAAEILQARCEDHPPGPMPGAPVIQFLNTVIGKMSGVVSTTEGVPGVAPICDGLPRCFLVEEFNRILISRIRLAGFERGIEAFVEKDDLLPFEEAKLYGHNAVHALLGYLAQHKGYPYLSDVGRDPELIQLGRAAFLSESGPALFARHAGVDPLFTPAGYAGYAEDLLRRMVNPHLRDRTDRVTRDPQRKLGWEDRLIGTMRLALDAGIQPDCFALGAAAAVTMLNLNEDIARTLAALWPGPDHPPGRKAELIRLIESARGRLSEFRCG